MIQDIPRSITVPAPQARRTPLTVKLDTAAKRAVNRVVPAIGKHGTFNSAS